MAKSSAVPRIPGAHDQPAWQQLGFRSNPFLTLPEDEEPLLGFLRALAQLIPKWSLHPPFRVLQIQGPRGWGKSTLMRLWHMELTAQAQPVQALRLLPRGKLPLPSGGWLLVDELHRLPRRKWRPLRRWLDQADQPRLIASTHVDLSDKLPVDLTWLLPGPGVEDVLQWFEFRLRRAGGETPLSTLTPQGARWLLRRWLGNFHDLLWVMFHLFESAPAAQLEVLTPSTLAQLCVRYLPHHCESVQPTRLP